jgi:hypothetical protein
MVWLLVWNEVLPLSSSLYHASLLVDNNGPTLCMSSLLDITHDIFVGKNTKGRKQTLFCDFGCTGTHLAALHVLIWCPWCSIGTWSWGILLIYKISLFSIKHIYFQFDKASMRIAICFMKKGAPEKPKLHRL